MKSPRISHYNPEILKWARKRSGRIETKEFEKLKPKILEWENRESFPTYNQLEKLADLYNIPLAVFFFPEPPDIEMQRPDFRISRNIKISELPNRFVRILDRASVMQMNLEELFGYLGEKPKNLLKDLSDLDYDTLLIELRNSLNISLEDQINLNPDSLLKKFRSELFKNGIFVFKEPFYDSSISGFCIYDENYPVIFLNNSMSKTRQLFTLLHELYHLITKTNSIDELSYSIEKNGIEKQCDQFAADFLIPKEECLDKVNESKMTFEFINSLANYFNVSFESMLIRLISLKIISWGWFNYYLQNIKEDSFPRKDNPGGNPYNSKISYLGNDYINLVYNAFNSNQISTLELCDYLGLKMKNLDQFNKYWS